MKYYGYLPSEVNEGGMSRNNAFNEYFNGKADIINLYTESSLLRFWKICSVIFSWFFIKGDKLFIHQISLLHIFPMKVISNSFFKKITFRFLKFVARRNKLIIEINDLIYEQAIDLQLYVHPGYSEFQKNLFDLKDAHFIFASSHMEKYVREKYALKNTNTQVVINGGSSLILNRVNFPTKYFEQIDKRKFIYAGSLDKGRQIEDLINIFLGLDDILFLIGNQGQWINDYTKSENIIYLGNFSEAEAHYLVSKCDMGIIPYDDTKFYYNICYPTKASFYITAGIPFLATELTELEQQFSKLGVTKFEKYENWRKVVSTTTLSEIDLMKKTIEKIKYLFEWENILSTMKL